MLLIILIAPPELPATEKWFGFGISIPSNRHNIPIGEFPRTIISFRSSEEIVTPAYFEAIRDGSPQLPAYFDVSSTVNVRVLIAAISLIASLFDDLAVTTTSLAIITV